MDEAAGRTTTCLIRACNPRDYQTRTEKVTVSGDDFSVQWAFGICFMG